MVVCHELKQKTAPSLKVFAKNYSWMCNFLGIGGKSVHVLVKTHPNVPVAFFDNFYVQSTLALPTQIEITWAPLGNCFNIFQLNPCTKGHGSPLLAQRCTAKRNVAISKCIAIQQSSNGRRRNATSDTHARHTQNTTHDTATKETNTCHAQDTIRRRLSEKKTGTCKIKEKNLKHPKIMFRKQTKNSEKNPLYCRKRLCQIEEVHGRTTLPHVAYTCFHTCGAPVQTWRKPNFKFRPVLSW